MKIIGAWVFDPTMVGDIEQPSLCVEVDHTPDVTIPIEEFSGGWKTGKCGPFVRYECSGGMVTARDFNLRFRTRFPVIVDIGLFVKGEESETVERYALPVSRARTVLAKFSPNWRLLVDDKAAEAGHFLWLPVETSPACRYQVKGEACGKRPASIMRISDVAVPHCEVHKRTINRIRAEERKAS